MISFHVLFSYVLATPLGSAELPECILPVVPSASLMLRPVRKMPNYFPETHHRTVSCSNQSDFINGALSILAL